MCSTHAIILEISFEADAFLGGHMWLNSTWGEKPDQVNNSNGISWKVLKEFSLQKFLDLDGLQVVIRNL